MSLVGSEGDSYASAKRHRERYDLISGYPIARCVVVRSKASAPLLGDKRRAFVNNLMDELVIKMMR